MDTAAVAVTAGFDVLIDEDGKPKISGSGSKPQPPMMMGMDGKPKPAFGMNADTKASGVELAVKKLLSKFAPQQATVQQGAKDYKVTLYAFATRIFSQLHTDLENVLGAKTPDNHTTADLKVTLINRATRILDIALQEGEQLAKD